MHLIQQFRHSDKLKPVFLQRVNKSRHSLDSVSVHVVAEHYGSIVDVLGGPCQDLLLRWELPINGVKRPKYRVHVMLVADLCIDLLVGVAVRRAQRLRVGPRGSLDGSAGARDLMFQLLYRGGGDGRSDVRYKCKYTYTSHKCTAFVQARTDGCTCGLILVRTGWSYTWFPISCPSSAARATISG